MAKARKVRKPQCAEPGCRKSIVEGEDYCRVHLEQDPTNAVMKLTELELLRFKETDTALHNHTLEIRNLDQEQQLAHVQFEQQKRVRQQRVNALKESIKIRSNEQRRMMESLGAKYGFDPTRTSIDDETGAIREMPPEE
jgi:hypothetical protein